MVSNRRHRHSLTAAFFAAVATMLLLVTSCNTTKHVPQGKYLLDNIDINITDKNHHVSKTELQSYLRQVPNHEVLGGLKLQLWFYNLSGHDSTKWANRWIQRVGTPPVIYDQELTDASIHHLTISIALSIISPMTRCDG